MDEKILCPSGKIETKSEEDQLHDLENDVPMLRDCTDATKLIVNCDLGSGCIEPQGQPRTYQTTLEISSNPLITAEVGPRAPLK